jgi:hypothetical protein
MASNDVVDIGQVPGGDDGASAADPFFRGLENESKRAGETRREVRQDVRDAQANRDVSVMSAGVTHAVVQGRKPFACRTMRCLVALEEFEGVDVEAKRDNGSPPLGPSADGAGESAAHDLGRSASPP